MSDNVGEDLAKAWDLRKNDWAHYVGKFIALRSDEKFYIGDTMDSALDKAIKDREDLAVYCDGIGVTVYP